MDCRAIKTEYITGNASIRELAEKYNVSCSTLEKKAHREKWAEERQRTATQWQLAATQTMEQAIVEQTRANANTIKLFDEACDLLLNRAITLASNELTSQEMRQLSATLKELKELKNIRSDADVREQEARIKKLEQEVNADNKDTTVTVRFDDGMSDWSK